MSSTSQAAPTVIGDNDSHHGSGRGRVVKDSILPEAKDMGVCLPHG
ncbi:hypothetical protein [Methermicoccus shengliensis]|uniref:Uncharacterized protein n=1 Tax=Methermicoccus shengliensis TaxID=660064 RepID=A0A832RXG8_9EURY|nr:hypothetical protein [Methermicoccus shengliensis]HIH69762.1 hypothetical protein [Methermicoccus shengliensis]